MHPVGLQTVKEPMDGYRGPRLSDFHSEPVDIGFGSLARLPTGLAAKHAFRPKKIAAKRTFLPA